MLDKIDNFSMIGATGMLPDGPFFKEYLGSWPNETSTFEVKTKTKTKPMGPNSSLISACRAELESDLEPSSDEWAEMVES